MAVRGLGPATLEIVQAVRAALSAEDTSLLVACSGGADSLALAAAAWHVASRSARPAAALVVDHRLQPGSGDVAAAAARQLRGMGYDDTSIVPVEVAAGGGPEGAARDARYAVLRSAAAATGATVLLGHTRDDQAETVLLGLARGSGVRSLSGMAARTGQLLRPLLSVPRASTERACAELGLLPWQDPQNADERIARARVRRQALPALEAALGPGVAAALARTAALARADADYLDRLAEAADPGTRVVECAALAVLAAPVRSRVLLRWLRRCGARNVSQVQVAAVEALVTQWHGQGPVALAGHTVCRVAGRLRLDG
jgi:tRNA(Ile)-lysidine synthase